MLASVELSLRLLDDYANRLLGGLHSLYPAGVVADDVLMAEQGHRLDFSVHFVLLDILVEGQVDADLLDGVEVLVEAVLYLEDAAKATLAQLVKFFEGAGIAVVLKVLAELVLGGRLNLDSNCVLVLYPSHFRGQ